MLRHPVIEQVDQPDPPRALDRRRFRRFDMLGVALMLPVICIVATGFVFQIYPGWPRVGLGLMFFGVLYFIVWILLVVFLGVLFMARCHLVWLRDRIDRRTDPVVQADDRDALFVKIVPRRHWPFEKVAMPTDVGLLVADAERGELRYEGDLERWLIPADAIRSFDVHSVVHEGKILVPFGFTVVLLWIELPDGVLRETPLACLPVRLELWTPRRQRERAHILARVIGTLVDPVRWPGVDRELLHRLRAPSRIPDAVDFG